MKKQSGQIPLSMRREDLATWDNWLSRPETATLERLLTVGRMPELQCLPLGRGGHREKPYPSGLL